MKTDKEYVLMAVGMLMRLAVDLSTEVLPLAAL